MAGNSNLIQILAGKEFKFKVKREKLFKFKPRRKKESKLSSLNILVFGWDSFPFLLCFKTVPERNGFQVSLLSQSFYNKNE